MDLDHLSQLYSLRGVRHDTHWWWCNVLLIGKTGIFFLQCLMEDSETHNNANHHWNILALLQRSKRREENKRKIKEKKKQMKGEKKRTGKKILVCEKKILVKKDQCNKSHSLIPLHSNWTCVLKAAAAGFISHPNRIKLWNCSWHKASEICCVQTRTGLPLLVWADVKMFQYLLTVVSFYFFSEPL